jgi:DNA-binding HxlR family transcriptional regulator
LAQYDLKDEGVSDLQTIRDLQVILNPTRLMILKVLKEHGEAWFSELKRDLGVSDGNLASHIKALEKLKFLEVRKQVIRNKFRTSYVLTNEGLNVLSHLSRVFGD